MAEQVSPADRSKTIAIAGNNVQLRKEVMEVCVKQGEIVNKHLKLEMAVGDVLCFGLDEKLVRAFAAHVAYLAEALCF